MYTLKQGYRFIYERKKMRIYMKLLNLILCLQKALLQEGL